MTNYLVSKLARGEGVRASRPSRLDNIKQHGLDGRAPRKTEPSRAFLASPVAVRLFNCMNPAEGILLAAATPVE